MGDFPAKLFPILHAYRNEVYIRTNPYVASITAERFVQNQMFGNGVLEDRLSREECPTFRTISQFLPENGVSGAPWFIVHTENQLPPFTFDTILTLDQKASGLLRQSEDLLPVVSP